MIMDSSLAKKLKSYQGVKVVANPTELRHLILNKIDYARLYVILASLSFKEEGIISFKELASKTGMNDCTLRWVIDNQFRKNGLCTRKVKRGSYHNVRIGTQSVFDEEILKEAYKMVEIYDCDEN